MPTLSDPLAPMLAAFDASAARSYTYQGTTVRLAYRSEPARQALGYVPAPWLAPAASTGFAFSSSDHSGREISFGYLGMGAQAFGLAGELARRGEAQLTSALGNPYFSLVDRHMHAGLGLPLAGAIQVKFGMLVSDPRATPPLELMHSGRRQTMAVGEISGQLHPLLWTMGLGRLQESGSVLGATQSGAFGFAGDARTTVLNFGLALSPSERIRVGAQYTVGYTGSLANRTDSLVTGYSAGRSEAYTAFAALKEAFQLGDSVTFSVSQPMRMSSGAVQMTVPVGADEDGRPVIESRSISLRPGARETRVDLMYMVPSGRDANWFVGLGVRQHPNHDSTAAREVILGLGGAPRSVAGGAIGRTS